MNFKSRKWLAFGSAVVIGVALLWQFGSPLPGTLLVKVTPLHFTPRCRAHPGGLYVEQTPVYHQFSGWRSVRVPQHIFSNSFTEVHKASIQNLKTSPLSFVYHNHTYVFEPLDLYGRHIYNVISLRESHGYLLADIKSDNSFIFWAPGAAIDRMVVWKEGRERPIFTRRIEGILDNAQWLR